jgi:hypothetical protein
MSTDTDRLAFVLNRDGLAGARDFARRSYHQYRKARPTPYGKSYRRQLVEGALASRAFLRQHREQEDSMK